ncbi:DUF2064 domain-containing protein [Allosaccharopolyspora coralli]|uniref:DUF2064 domain-containing protein n=1 Tax=Allosaccharopolyspora coralli TaxID=2665642 RepID=A0A5Q3Q751_9PSEU|nr:TIGR04282 family arsenosugar biosynthesis glycosyltransferase [Allosaccharopolyspora coralli]QGK70491.1 DUF2064 domain-containing protein [Allosaccharopolyspora coralli]
MSSTALLVVAKAPEPGHAKTRLCPPLSPEGAAQVAAASLLDTMSAVLAVPEATAFVAWTGTLQRAVRSAEIERALAEVTLLAQRGDGLGERLAAAHSDVAEASTLPVLQIGMDTPQATARVLTDSTEPLHRQGGPDAVLGLAEDGGWWALGLRDPRHARVLHEVPMSSEDTGERTLQALRAAGLSVELLPRLRDVDTMDDAIEVAAHVPRSHFADAISACTAESA